MSDSPTKERTVPTVSDEAVRAMLDLDPLAEAEKLTGHSYKEDESTQGLGFVLLQVSAQAKDEALTARGDTTFRNTLERYVGIIEAYGFRQVLDLPFEDYGYAEHKFVYWHDDGLLLTFDTYQAVNVNGGHVYYNWRPNDPRGHWGMVVSSGHFSGEVWSGYHDCREALIFNLDQLRTNGKFVSPWVDDPKVWLMTRTEAHAVDDADWLVRSAHYDDVIEANLARLPEDVRKAISVGLSRVRIK